MFYHGNRKINSCQEPIKNGGESADSLSHRKPFVHLLCSHQHCGPDKPFKKWVRYGKFMVMTQSISKEEPHGVLPFKCEDFDPKGILLGKGTYMVY